MKKIIIMKGLPGSGKSTWAKKLVDEHPNAYKRINRDDLRAMLDNGYNSDGNEKFIKKVRDMLIVKALEEGKHVIVDDTNLSDSNETRIRQLAKEFTKNSGQEVLIEIKEMDTSLEECIRRDAERLKPVGDKVIKQMHHRFMHKDPDYVKQDSSKPKAILCDLDGTLALLNGRNPFDAAWCEKDLLNEPVASVVRTYAEKGYAIVLLSGRKEAHRPQSLRWLEKYSIPYTRLLMRPSEDTRKDSIVKREIFEKYIKSNFFIEFILDDRDQVVDMWRRELGLPCLQVYYGNF